MGEEDQADEEEKRKRDPDGEGQIKKTLGRRQRWLWREGREFFWLFSLVPSPGPVLTGTKEGEGFFPAGCSVAVRGAENRRVSAAQGPSQWWQNHREAAF
jgi:hypothetical protein